MGVFAEAHIALIGRRGDTAAPKDQNFIGSSRERRTKRKAIRRRPGFFLKLSL